MVLILSQFLNIKTMVLYSGGSINRESPVELAKQTMYWPGINGEIEQFVASCQPYAASNKKCPEKKNQLGQEIPVTPWMKLGTDIFTLDGVNYLLIVDYTSKFPVV